MYEYKAKLSRVVDGDTVDLRIDLGFKIHMDARVRLLGINTPETRTRDLVEKKLGLLAKDRLIELLDDQDIIVQTRLDKSGKYGRVLGVILFGPDRRNANQILLDEGHAVPYLK